LNRTIITTTAMIATAVLAIIAMSDMTCPFERFQW
jgi:hypothetical protein